LPQGRISRGKRTKAPMADDAWKLSAAAAMVPFCSFLYLHKRGGTVRIFEWTYRHLGVGGFFALPFVSLSMEKCVYDSVQAYQGRDANIHPPGAGKGFPSGGHQLPSFSLIPVNTEYGKKSAPLC